MSMNRRRWSNKFIEAMREFLNREEAEATDSLGKVTMSTNSSNETHYTDVTSTLNSPKDLMSLKSQSTSENDSEYSLAIDKFNEDLCKNDLYNKIDLNEKVDHNVNLNSDYLNTTIISDTSDIRTSITVALDNNILCKKSEVDLIQFNESLNLNVQSTELKSVKNQFHDNFKQNDQNINYQNNFSSPESQIYQIDQPDVWEALIALEQELSPFDEREKTIHQQDQDFPQILSRLSQKFKETPTKFTEKLVSIIEDSIVSSESPSKQNVADVSGISLSRMTGEFRKLCKFIDEESMPEWAPSLINMTMSYSEKKQTPDNDKHEQNINKTNLKSTLKNIDGVNTPNQKINCKLLDSFVTPKNKIISNVDSPIKKFTPSADKSFEYWEKVCNMMCNSQSSGKKKVRRSISVSESTKRSLNEMLTICERQMASLDDSTIDIRNSEPYKKTDEELKIIQMPRSKSESRIYMNLSNEKRQSSCEHFYKSAVIESLNIHTENNSNENVLKSHEEMSLKKNADLMEKDEENYRESFSINKSWNDNEEDNGSSDDDDVDEDCSLLIELAKRRQRCLDTAKLMMEIDREDPDTSGDSKCLETLYKLGVQDKTFIEDKDDAKFFNTLGHCLEYKKYFHDKSKPLLNIMQKINSPDNLQNKTTSAIKSKKSAIETKFNTPTLNRNCQQQHSLLTKTKVTLHSEPRNRLTSLHNRKVTASKPVTKSFSVSSQKLDSRPSHLRVTPCAEKKTLPSVNRQPVKHFTSRQIVQRITPKHPQQNPPSIKRNILQQQKQQLQHTLRKKTSTPVTRPTKPDQKVIVEHYAEKLSPKVSTKVPTTIKQSNEKKKGSEILQAKKYISRSKSSVCSNNENDDPSSPDGCGFFKIQESAPPETPPKSRFFFTPGKSPVTSSLGRKKPASYFSDFTLKKPITLNSDYDGIKSPINMYIHSTDNDLIQNVKGRTEDFLLTPISNQGNGKSPRLKMKLSPSKENKSPFTSCNENKILTVRYQSADKVRLIDDKSSYSPCSLTPNSRTKKLLEPIENTKVIRHEGRVTEYNTKSDEYSTETSIRVQKMAEKIPSMQKKYT